MEEVKKDAIWVFVDNEGPCTLNDNAQENMVALARECGLGEEVGVKAYKNTSNIDDIWGDFHRIAKDPTYSSGHTLKIVLPFYKAMGTTSQWLYDFAKNNLRVVPNIGQVLVNLNREYNLWKISTSYEFFIRAFCDKVGFDFSRARCTFVERFDEIPITKKERDLLQSFLREVAQMPAIEYDGKTGQVMKDHQVHYDRFTDFVWETLYNMPVGELLRIVHPVGQTQKREAVEEICQEFGVPKEKVMYVGDSQTDVQCVEWLQGAGLTMMFNGKGQVCRISDIMYIGEDAKAIGEVANLFAERGRRGVIDYYTPPREAKCGGLLTAVTPENIVELEPMSIKKRKEFRGIHIGDLT